MADEIKLKAPTVEQQVVVNINGEEKLRSFADTLEKISNNKNLQKYWKTQQELINATADAYGNFSKKASQDNAKELIKVTNALKAMSGTDLSNILPDFDKISKAMAEAQKVAGNIDSAFSVKGFKEAFDSFETLKAYGVDIQNLFSHFGVSSDIGELQKNVRSLEGEVEKLTRRLTNAKNANEELRNEFDNFKSGSGFADKLDELDNLKSEMSYLREQAEETFRQFLKLNNITEDGYDRDGFYDDNRFKEYFQNIQSGYLSASDAIQQFKREYAYLLDDSFKSNNDTFGLEQLQAFSNKLDSIFRQVEETSTKINDIISNGVITKSVENLSMDSSLSDSQRSLFGNLLQDEESLKSITALFQKLIEESNKTSKVDLFNDEQLQQVLSIFDKMEDHLSSLRSIISDVGDGEEFSPLLKMINNVQSSISELSTSVKGIGLNMNIDVGSDDELDRKLQTKVANALQAYQKLFNNIKMSSAGGSLINQDFFDFNLDNYDTAYQKLQAIVNFIKKQRVEAKKQFNGYDALYEDSDKSLWKSAKAYLAQVTKAETEIKKANSGESNPLENLFGNTKDLSEVIEQLNKVVEKLNEISSSATEFKNIFKEGFNVTASVEEIDKLTNRVKELEDELAKIKLNPVSVNKSNISSGTQIKDVIQGGIEEKSIDTLKAKIKEIFTDTDELKRVLKSLDEGSYFHLDWYKDSELNDFTDVDERIGKLIPLLKEYGYTIKNLNSSSDSLETSGSIVSLADENDKLEKITTSAKEAATSKEKFANANKEVKASADSSKTSISEEEKYFNSLGKSLTQYQNTLTSISRKPADGNRSQELQEKIDIISSSIEKLNDLKSKTEENGYIFNKNDVDTGKQLEEIIKKNIELVKQMSSAQKGSDALSRGKEIDTITKYLNKFTGISKQAKRELNGLLDQLQSGDPSVNVKKIHERFLELTVAERNAGREARNLFDIFKDKKIYSFLGQAASMFSFYDLINVGRQIVANVKDIDTALTELRKVSDATEQRLTTNFKNSADTAKELGATISDVISATADWSRMGYNIDQAEELARVSTLYKNVGDGIDIETANNSLISTLQGFQLDASEAESIIDKFNEVANNYAIDSAGIGEALQRSAASFNAANTDLSKSIALITATNEVVQDPDSVGTLWKTMSARIRGAETELQQLNEETDEYTKTTSKLRDLVMGLTGFDIMEDEDTFKDIYEIILGIGQEWQNLTDAEQASLGEALAGKRNANALYAVLGNLDTLQSAYETAEESAGK